MGGFIYLSQEGYDKLKKELEELKSVKRPEIAQKISEARDFGDLRENAEYHAAKEAMALLENRIAQLEETLRRAKIINKKDLSDDQVSIYTTVLLKDLVRNQEVQYTLVSPEESDFKQKKISTTSPVGKALLGKKVGDVVEIQVPAGTLRYEVLEIKLSI
ncbi:MAG: transcription elongation factor GreA [Calditrichaeota bacterium]|nr:transcription elongation factor GreA [Calditrichota bacterium]